MLQFHTGICAQVVMTGSQSSIFPVDVGVKQGCVLAQVVFNLFIVAITLVSLRDLRSSNCVGIEYRLDGGLFNLRLFQAKTKTSFAVIFVALYADVAAFLSLTADGLQRRLDVMSETYLRAGLIINTTKTEIPLASLHVAPTSSISGKQLKITHFLVTSQMRSKNPLTLLHQPLADRVNVCLVREISGYTLRLLYIMQL